MEPTTSYQPRVSRETRLLLTAAVVAVAVLWLLARVRFRDRTVPPSPIPAVLSQLTSGPKLDALAEEVGALTARLRPSLAAIDPGLGPAGPARPASRIAGLRIRDDVAIAGFPSMSGTAPLEAISIDRAAGIALFHAQGTGRAPPLAGWAPREPQGPRYLVATEIVGTDVSLRPTFIASFEAIGTPLWAEPVWAVPAGSDLSAGSVVFTNDGELVGLVIAPAGRRVIVPTATLLAEAERLLAAPQPPPGTLDIEVQPITPALAAATGAQAGVVVAWVDRAGAAAGRLRVGDAIEAIDQRPVNGRGDWDVIAARLSAGRALALRVRSRGTVQDVTVVAAASTPPATDALGLTLRSRVRTGAEVVGVQRGSAAERAGLAMADVITLIGDVAAPTPRQVTHAFASLRPGEHALLGVTRGDAHVVTTLERSP